jgi:uncharacterized protein with von Willebrand factor type A (vWA) domain
MHRPATVRCYDCNQQVAELKPHRKVCPNSRQNRSRVECTSSSSSSKPSDCQYIEATDFYALIDVSGSMNGQKLENAKSVLSSFFDSMKESDRLAIISFDSEAFFKLKPRPVGQLRRQNELPEILSRIFAQGQTALYDAIWLAVSQIRDKNRKTILNVLTDGQANASSHSYGQIIELLEQDPSITLNIVHIDNSGSRLLRYDELCYRRGTYVVIKETEIVSETTRIYRESYIKN